MELDGTSLVKLRDNNGHLKNSTAVPLSRDHDLLTEDKTHTWLAAVYWRLLS